MFEQFELLVSGCVCLQEDFNGETKKENHKFEGPLRNNNLERASFGSCCWRTSSTEGCLACAEMDYV